MRIYAQHEVRKVAEKILKRDNDFSLSVTPNNIQDLQSAIDSDSDCTLKLKTGWCFFKPADGRMEIHSNDSHGRQAGGTEVIAVVI